MTALLGRDARLKRGNARERRFVLGARAGRIKARRAARPLEALGQCAGLALFAGVLARDAELAFRAAKPRVRGRDFRADEDSGAAPIGFCAFIGRARSLDRACDAAPEIELPAGGEPGVEEVGVGKGFARRQSWNGGAEPVGGGATAPVVGFGPHRRRKISP